MDPTVDEGVLDGTALTPLVRASHNQIEVDYLPPYGDPEVSIPGELATYAVVGGLAVAAFERLGRRHRRD